MLKGTEISVVPTLALIGQKGGVGRSTIAVNVSYSLAKRGWRVLLVDADLQGGVGFSLTEKSKDAVGFYDFLTGLESCDALRLREVAIRTKLPALSLLTRGSKRALESVLAEDAPMAGARSSVQNFNDAVKGLGYDIVIYDTPSGINAVSSAVSRVVDFLLIPQQSTPLCLRSLPHALRMVAAARSGKEPGEGPRLAGFVLSMTDSDDPSNLVDQREFRELLPLELVLETVIPVHRDFREASRVGVPVAMLRDRPSASALIFDQLAAELEFRLNLYEDDENAPLDRDDYARLVD